MLINVRLRAPRRCVRHLVCYNRVICMNRSRRLHAVRGRLVLYSALGKAIPKDCVGNGGWQTAASAGIGLTAAAETWWHKEEVMVETQTDIISIFLGT